MERNNVITSQGNALTLLGPELKVGDKAPEFTALANDMSPVKLSDSKGKVRLFSVAPSLDTGVCEAQAVTFNKKVADLGDDVALYQISADLPFAQTRFCAAKAVDKLQTISDHREVDFGEKYGVLIKELRLLARSVVVVDKNDTISYMQIVPEVTTEPDYDSALSAVKDALKK